MSRRTTYLAFALAGLLSTVTLGGCEDNSVGILTIYSNGFGEPGITNLVIAIKSLEVGGDGPPVDIDTNEPADITVDLAAGRVRIMGNIVLPTGDYKWIRLNLDQADSFVIAENGDRYSLDVPSVFESDGPFTIGKSVNLNLVVDVDVRRALSHTLQDGVPVYTLQPISQLINLAETGTIVGRIPSTAMIGSVPVTDPSCIPVVYAFPGGDVTPEGYEVPVPGGTPPLEFQGLVLHEPQDVYTYRETLLPVGRYTVALTCSADDFAGSTKLMFTPAVTVKVSAGGTATADLGS